MPRGQQKRGGGNKVAAYGCISFLTDYGLEDGFVASCHGVAARILPDIRIFDITHLIPAGDVRRGARVLAQTVPYLPAGVHVAVVDPGVGTDRRGIAVEAGERIFVGPDNGLLSWAVQAAQAGGPRSEQNGRAAAETGPAPAAGPGQPPGTRQAPGARAFELANPDLWLAPVSPTFHGRDIFTPVAARLAAGLDLATVGPPVPLADLITLPSPMRRIREGTAEGEVLMIDRFGNVQLSVTAADLREVGARTGGSIVLVLGRRRLPLPVPYRETFGAVPPGELVAYADSAGCIALAVNSGNAARRLDLPPGAHVRIVSAPADPPLRSL